MTKKIFNFKDIIDFKKVMSLTKVLCKDFLENLMSYKSKNLTQGKLFKICVIIVIVGLSYLSYHIINFLNKIGQASLFLNIYLLIMGIIIILQQVIASTNIYYFSKDLEYILPFPIKPIELLIARFNMLISISYITIAMFVLIPLIMYGLIASTSILYYPGLLIVLITFPIFFGLISSTIMLFVMQLSKIIKNKEAFQFIATFIVTFIIMTLVMQGIVHIFSNMDIIERIEQGEQINLIQIINDKIHYVNNYLVTINPSIKMLLQDNFLNNLLQLLKIIFANVIGIIVFIFFGKWLYLRNILKNIEKVNPSKTKRHSKKYQYKKVNKAKVYIKNEFTQLVRTPAFFMQCILPVLLVVISLTGIIIAIHPSLSAILQDEELSKELGEFKFDISVLAVIIIIMQIIFTFSNLSITAISRKGKNAFFIKYIPIPLYKQFLYMNLPQIILNTFISIIVLGLCKYLIPEINIIYLIAMFAISIVLNIINSFLMLVADLRKPNLEWDNETDAIKQNKNKLYQYVLTIIIILILIYFQEVLEKVNLNLSIILILIILTLVLLIMNKIIKNKINKLFNKII